MLSVSGLSDAEWEILEIMSVDIYQTHVSLPTCAKLRKYGRGSGDIHANNWVVSSNVIISNNIVSQSSCQFNVINLKISWQRTLRAGLMRWLMSWLMSFTEAQMKKCLLSRAYSERINWWENQAVTQTRKKLSRSMLLQCSAAEHLNLLGENSNLFEENKIKWRGKRREGPRYYFLGKC